MGEKPNRHHIPFPEKLHSLHVQSLSLRNERSLIPLMDAEAHRELHRNVPLVPLMGYYGLCAVRRDFQTTNNTIQDVEQLQRLMERTKHHRRAHSIENSLTDLAIEAYELQKPYLIEGMIR